LCQSKVCKKIYAIKNDITDRQPLTVSVKNDSDIKPMMRTQKYTKYSYHQFI